MTDQQRLLDRLDAEQRILIERAAEEEGLPSQGEIRRIAELENAIAAVAALIEERRDAVA